MLKLKEWVTVPEAANHLSAMFEEDVREADVLRLAIDGHLKLSVNFIGHVDARCGKIISCEDVERAEGIFKIQLPDRKVGGTGTRTAKLDIKTAIGPFQHGVHLDDHRFLNLSEDIIILEGVWDLSMIGNERLAVEYKYQQLTNGPEVELLNLTGTFVERHDGSMCQLQEEFEEENFSGSFYPAGGLPRDSVLVVRTKALVALQEQISSGKLTEVDCEAMVVAPVFDKKHNFYARELKIAVEVWTELYEKNPPKSIPRGGHKRYINNWLEEKHPSLGQRARDRISTVINPNPKGGASPISISE